MFRMISERISRRALVLVAAIVSMTGGQAHAIDLYNNLNQTQFTFGSVSNVNSYSFSFSTTATETVLTNISAYLKVNSAATGILTVSIYNAVGGVGLPDTKINDAGTINNASISTSSYATYSISGLNFNLSPSTKYYVVFSNSTSDNIIIGLTNSSTGTNSNATYYNNGSGWNYVSFNAMGSVSAIAQVPEPSTYALATIATGLMAAVARRKG